MQSTPATLTDTGMIRLLHSCNVRPSIHRLAVLGYVANHRTHPTADEVYTVLTADYPGVSRTTVYNSLHTLVEAGVLRQLEIDGEATRYDLASLTPHSHFRCHKCGHIFDMVLPAGLSSMVDPGFRVETTDLIFTGLCPHCTTCSTPL